jgi:hypothetical protein
MQLAARPDSKIDFSDISPLTEDCRVFVQGATGFVSIQSVRDDAEQRAKEFCARKHQTMESLAETTAKPPYILGNFPRVLKSFLIASQSLMLNPRSPETILGTWSRRRPRCRRMIGAARCAAPRNRSRPRARC